eukprot:gene3350-13381_t
MQPKNDTKHVTSRKDLPSFHVMCSHVHLKQVLENPDPQIACAAANAAHHAPPDMMDIPVQQLLDQLVEQRSEVSDHDPELSRLDGMIISLMTITRKMFSAGPYDIIHGSPPSSPEAPEGSMLQDLKEINLRE